MDRFLKQGRAEHLLSVLVSAFGINCVVTALAGLESAIEWFWADWESGIAPASPKLSMRRPMIIVAAHECPVLYEPYTKEGDFQPCVLPECGVLS